MISEKVINHKMNQMFETPMCDTCGVKFDNISTLDVHMKSVHKESESNRIQRRTEMAKYAANSLKNAKEHSVNESKKWQAEPQLKQKTPVVGEKIMKDVQKSKKEFECDKCEEEIGSNHELYNHMKEKHNQKTPSSPYENIPEFDFKIFPGGYSIKKNKGKQSKVYDKAFDETTEMFKNANKKAELHMKGGLKVKVIDLPPGKQSNKVDATIEVSANDCSTNVNMIFYTTTKSIKITKMKCNDMEGVDLLANDILKPHPLFLIRGNCLNLITLKNHRSRQ